MPVMQNAAIRLDEESVAGEEDPGAALDCPPLCPPAQGGGGAMQRPDAPSQGVSGDATRLQIQAIAEHMKQHKLVMTTAESCTAGLIAARLADLPGAGSLLESAFVVYSPQAKQHCLGVTAQTLERCNLTSEQVAAEMAQGALQASHHANLAVANTGVTDDTDPDIPAGTQCFAWLLAAQGGRGEKLFTETRRFSGDRNEIRESAAAYALQQIPVKHAEWLGTAQAVQPG